MKWRLLAVALAVGVDVALFGATWWFAQKTGEVLPLGFMVAANCSLAFIGFMLLVNWLWEKGGNQRLREVGQEKFDAMLNNEPCAPYGPVE